MARFKTFANGGDLLPADLNSIQDDHDLAFSAYKRLVERVSIIGSSAAAATYPLGVREAAVTAAADGIHALAPFYLDPADFAAGSIVSRTTKYRVRALVIVNSTAPTVNFTVGLYPVSTITGADPDITLGTVVAGSTCLSTAPGATTKGEMHSNDFTAPSAGFYALGVVVSGTTAASSITTISAELQMRQV